MVTLRYKTRFSLANPSSVIAAVKAFQAWVKEKTTWLITAIMLLAMYILGIGASALGKRLVSRMSASVWPQGWQQYIDSGKLEKMY